MNQYIKLNLLILFLFFFIKTNAQVVPGNVTGKNLRVWLKADGNKTLSGNNVTTWFDYSGGNRNYSSIAGIPPIFKATVPRMNYNPTLFFDNDKASNNNNSNYLSIATGPMSVNNPVNATSFVVYYVESINFNRDELYTHGFGSSNEITTRTRRPAIGIKFPSSSNSTIGTGKVRNSGDGTTDVYGRTYDLYSAYKTTIQGTHTTSGLVNFYFNGKSLAVTTNDDFSTDFEMASGGTIGAASTPDRSFIGDIAEVIMYENVLLPDEINKVQSYLALKYGVTLDNINYILSDGTTIWNRNAAQFSSFSNNIAGIVRDDNSGLLQKQSRSTNNGAIVTMALQEIKDKLSDVPGDIQQDKSSLMWGDNGATGTTSVSSNNPGLDCGPFSELESPKPVIKLNRKWLANNIGEAKVVQLSPYKYDDDNTATNIYPFTTNHDVYLVISATDPTLNTYDQVIKGEWINGKLLVNYTFPPNSRRYFTFYGIYQGPPCPSCSFYGAKRLEFTKQNWPRGSRTQNFNLSGLNVTINVTLGLPSIWRTNRYPRRGAKKSLKEMRYRGNGSEIMQTEIILSTGAKATFEIFDIDRTAKRFDNVEVYGLTCNGTTIKPKLFYYKTPDRSSYVIDDNVAKANKRTSGYTSKRGRMYVVFDEAVEKIYIEETFTTTGSSGTGLKNLGIGPIDFYCPTPPPAPSEDGIILIKQGNKSVELCEDIDYYFEIINTNCDSYTMNFSDILPSGLFWIEESLSINEALVTSNTIINNYENSNNLNISNITVPGGGGRYYIRASARFTETATASNYTNRATAQYTSKVNSSNQVTQQSCDSGSAGCLPTVTTANNTSVRLKPLKASISLGDKLCFNENEEINIKLTIKNENIQSLQSLIVEYIYDDTFSYVLGSLSSATLTLGQDIILSDGYIEIDNLNIPPGDHEINFSVRTPSSSNILFDSNLEALPFGISFGIESDSDSVCESEALTDSYGDYELPYCKEGACVQNPTAGVITRTNVGISDFKDQFSNWPQNVANGHLVLESSSRGLVLTRQNANNIPADKRVEGMIIYDTSDNCIKIFNGTSWNCIQRKCNSPG